MTMPRIPVGYEDLEGQNIAPSFPSPPPGYEDLEEENKNRYGLFNRATTSALAAGGKMAGNIFQGLGKVATTFGDDESFFLDVAKRFKETSAKQQGYLNANPAINKKEKVADFVGAAIPQTALGMGITKTFVNPLTSKLATTSFGKVAQAVGALAKNKAVGAGVTAGIASAPAEIIGAYGAQAITDTDVLAENPLAPVAYGLFGAGINGLIGGRNMSKMLKDQLKSLPPDTPIEQVIDVQNKMFDEAVVGAREQFKNLKTAYNSIKNDLGKPDRPSAAVTKAINMFDKVLKSLQVDGVSANNLARLEGVQTRAIDALNEYGFAAVGDGKFTPEQFKKFDEMVTALSEIKLPEYNFAAATPSVSAVQRLTDNLAENKSILMDPNATPGSAASLIASKRPDNLSAYNSVHGFIRKLKDQYQNYKSPLQIFGEPRAELMKAESVFNTAARLSGNNGRVYQNLEVQPMLPDGLGGWKIAEIDGSRVMNLNEVLQISGTDDASLAQLNGYLVAKQIADGNANIPGFTKEWADKEIADLTLSRPDVIKAGTEFFRRNKMMAEYMRPSFGDEVVNEWLKKDYSPMNRALSKAGESFGFTKGRTGSSSDLVFNPIAQHINNVGVSMAATEKTLMWQKVYDAVESNKEKFANSATIVQTDPKVIQQTLKEVKKANPMLGEIEARKIANLLSGVGNNKADKTVTFLHKGSMRTLRFSDDFTELFNGFEGPGELSKIGNVFKKAESFPRTIFSLVNDLTMVGPLRDIAETYVNDPTLKGVKGIGRVFSDFIKGYGEVANEGELFQQVMASGGAIGGRYVAPNSGQYQTSLDFVMKKARGEGEGFIRALEKISANLSQASRMGAAIRIKAAGGDSDEMARMFRSVIADPQQVGSKMQAATRLTAFMNMGVQSAAKTVNQFKTQPALTIMKGVEGISIPAVLLWFANRDDEEIQNLKNSKGGEQYFYMRPFEGEPIVKFPKPYLYGQIFGTGVESVLDGLAGSNPEALDNVKKGIYEQLAINVIPLSLQALAQGPLGGKFLGLGEGMVPTGGATNNQMPEDQRYLNTTTTARKVAEYTGVPAAMVDDVARTFLTNEPYRMLSYFDRVATNRTAPTVEDIPLAGKFLATEKKSNTGYLNSFYKKANEHADVVKSFNDAAAKGDVERLNRLGVEKQAEYKQAVIYAEGLKGLQEMRSALNIINENTMLTPEERREQLDKMFKSMNDYTKMFMESVEPQLKK